MKILGFHRGANSWVCEFELDGRIRVAYLDRPSGRWMYAHMEKIDAMTRGEMDVEMTNELKKYLEQIGVITKGEDHGIKNQDD